MATLPNPLPRLATLGLRLPPGRLVDVTSDGPWHEPLLWYAEQPPSPGDWAALAPPAARLGLLPVLVDTYGADGGGPERWALCPELMSYPGDHDAEEVLADFWGEHTGYETEPDERPTAGTADHPPHDTEATEATEATGQASYDDTLAPFGPAWPGLAPAGQEEAADPDVRAAEVADSVRGGRGSAFHHPRLALVPARRSADIPAAIGWTGPLNHENDVARLCAVLRSWEDRFGTRVVALTSDTLVVSVAAPPLTPDEAEAVAAEHFAFCPDSIMQGDFDDLRTYAKNLIGERSWSFWWD